MRAPAELEIGARIQPCGVTQSAVNVQRHDRRRRTLLAHSFAVVRNRSLHLAVEQAEVAACERQTRQRLSGMQDSR